MGKETVEQIWYSSKAQQNQTRREEIQKNYTSHINFPKIAHQSEFPSFLYLQITSECPLHCQMCNMGRICKDPTDRLTDGDYMNLIEEFTRFPNENYQKLIVFTGGEPFLKKELIFKLSKLAHQHGIMTAINTNGMVIVESDYQRLLTEGPSHLIFSVDAMDAETNDKIRGQKGFWENQIQHLKKLSKMKREMLKSKDKWSQNHSIMVNTIIGKFNYQNLSELVKWIIQDIGSEAIVFQPLAHTFLGEKNHDSFFQENTKIDIPKLEKTIEKLIELKRHGFSINMDEYEIRWLKDYFQNPEHTTELICDSYQRNLMVSVQGLVSICSNQKEYFDDFLGKFPDESLYALWTSKKATIMRTKMEKCRRNCGMLNCHRRQDYAKIFATKDMRK